MSLSPLREMMKELVQHHIATEDQVRECLALIPRKGNLIVSFLDAMSDRKYLTPMQIERIKLLDYRSLVLGGNKLLYENAAGSFARVYRAARIDNNEMICVKVLRQRWSGDPEMVDLFRREAETGKKLKHPNIVPIHDIGFDDGSHFFTMDFIEGGNLKDFIRIRGKLKADEAVRYIIDIARGLEYAQALGFTHRDLKMTNVLMSSNGVAKLIDFGLAADEETIRKVGDAFVNALEYTTLEKGTGAPRNDPRSDLFFLGVIFYELICGHPAYESTRNRDERKRLSRYTGIRPILQAEPACHRMVALIIDRLLHANPADRYQSATELIRDLRQAQAVLAQAAVNQPTLPQARTAPVSTSREIAHADLKPDSGSRLPETQGGMTTPAEVTAKKSSQVVLFLESRMREQNIIRDYFSRHGFRVLMMSDPSRLVARLQSETPGCLVVMGESLGEKIWSVWDKLLVQCRAVGCPVMMVAGRGDADADHPAQSGARESLQYQPVTLRSMRKEIQRLQGLDPDSEADTQSRNPGSATEIIPG